MLLVLGTSVGASRQSGGQEAFRDGGHAPSSKAGDVVALEQMLGNGDVPAQRRHLWKIWAQISRQNDGVAGFESWHGEGELFGVARHQVARGIKGFSPRPNSSAHHSLGVPVLAYTLYNDAAYHHIRTYQLNEARSLDHLLQAGPPDREVRDNKSIPEFPRESVILKTVWWPVAADAKTVLPVWEKTVLPVWDAGQNPALPDGNPFTSWPRALTVVSAGVSGTGPRHIAGNANPDAQTRAVDLTDFYSVPVDRSFAERLMSDWEASRNILVALGRPIKAGDYLILVAANVMTRELPNWIWGAFWWHDDASSGPFAQARPSVLRRPWNNYLMQPAFDSERPEEPDGTAHIAFNPWLEARFPDGGHGGGVVSNCVSCHQRASYPPIPFLPVTRGRADRANDPAYAKGRLRTSFLWSIAIHAAP